MGRWRRYGGQRPWDSWDSWGYRPSPPRKVRGGIKAQSRQGGFTSTWWGRRWNGVLQSFGIRSRLARGGSYARSGQVLDLCIASGEISARVQGTRKAPYAITIKLKTLPRATWKKIAAAVARRPILASKLLAGEMPIELEEVFAKSGAPLFPVSRGDLKTKCSCPDWSNPCKHIAAVYYLLAEAFDRDPFLLLRLRGLGREALLALIRGKRSLRAAAPEAKKEKRREVPLSNDPSRFWRTDSPGPAQYLEASKPGARAALLRRLGPVPFWRSGVDFLPFMYDLYEKVSGAAEMILAGEAGQGEESEKEEA